MISKNILISLDVNKLARAKWKVDRGYSSGASSYASDDDENSDHHKQNDDKNQSLNGTTTPKVVLELPFDPKKISPPRNTLHRNTSEVSCLSELKETIEKDGDLAKTIVRMEVRHMFDELFLFYFHSGSECFLDGLANMFFCRILILICSEHSRLHLIPPLKKYMMVC